MNFIIEFRGSIMKIAVICANGRIGSLIVDEIIARGLEVTAIARSKNKTIAKNFIQKDLFDLTAQDINDFDVIIDAFGTWTLETLGLHDKSLQYLCDLVSGKNTRLIVVGGAGSLYLDKTHEMQVMQMDNFPEIFKPLAQNMGKALENLRLRSDVNWTYISPACDFQAEAARTGKYILGGEELIVNAQGESIISYADYAIAVVDEVIKAEHNKERISVVKA